MAALKIPGYKVLRWEKQPNNESFIDPAEYPFLSLAVPGTHDTSPVAAFRAGLDPLRRTVERQDFLAGEGPGYADYIVFGAFQWARAISEFEVLAADDPVRAWRGRMLDLHDGLARRAPAYGN